MTQQDYEQKKRECWEEYTTISPQYKAFSFAFDRAYALGKQTETITQEEIEMSSLDYVLTRQKARHNAKNDEEASLSDFDNTLKAWDAFDMAQAYEDGANFALGKQEKDAEDTVIQGWVAIDEAYGQGFLHAEKPIQKAQPIADTGDYDTVWDSNGKTYLIDAGLFPDMDSDSDPLEVEIIIKRKKK